MTPAGPRQKLLDRVRHAIRTRHYSRRTEQAYVNWIRRYIAFHRMTHPAQMGASHVSQFLTRLAVDRRVSASTQDQALSALLFLYTHVLAIEIPAIPPVVRARTPERLPVVLSREEVDAILAHLVGVAHLCVMLLYGTGLRLEECLTLRVKDVDFDRHQIIVRQGKGQKDRTTMLPASTRESLAKHLADVQRLHARDLALGFGRVALPFALDRKFPSAPAEWRWQFVFPATRICRDPRFGPPSRYHLHGSVIQKALAHAARAAGIMKRVGPHTMRHSFATRLLEAGYDIRGAGTARPSRRQDDDDVSPRHEPWRPGREEPDGSTVSGYARGSRVSTGAPVAPPARNRLPMNRFVWHGPPRSFLDTRQHPRVSVSISHLAEGVGDGLRAYPPSGDRTPAKIALNSWGLRA